MENQIQQPERWNEMKGDLRKNWNKISEKEWDETRGDESSMTSILQKKYGLSEDDSSKKLSTILEKYRSGEAQENDLGKNYSDKPMRDVPQAARSSDSRGHEDQDHQAGSMQTAGQKNQQKPNQGSGSTDRSQSGGNTQQRPQQSSVNQNQKGTNQSVTQNQPNGKSNQSGKK